MVCGWASTGRLVLGIGSVRRDAQRIDAWMLDHPLEGLAAPRAKRPLGSTLTCAGITRAPRSVILSTTSPYPQLPVPLSPGVPPQIPMPALISEKGVPASKITRRWTPSDVFASKPGSATMPRALRGGDNARGGIDTPVIGDREHSDAERVALVEQRLVVVVSDA